MPEIKNTFLAGKMNKSLDDRIVPKGEYRDALNVQVTKAEGTDVGVIHNIKGNDIVASLGLGNGYEVIGSFFDEKDNIIYWFVTDNNHSYIYKFDKKIYDDPNNPANSTIRIVHSDSPDNWLNFNTSNKITGVNLLEDFLFWTDGLNPPRKINVTRADDSYYDSEIKVSVAKYAPYLAPDITAVENDPLIKSRRIEKEFVRFAYRYKFVDNEYSLISPFTPMVFEMENNIIDTSSNYYNTSDLKELGASTEMPLMVNNINKVTMNIPLPSGTTGAKEDYEIEKIDVLYKESDSSAIRVIETIDVSSANTSGSEQYIYKSSNFKTTLPEDQITRVFDTVPIKAKAQEVAGNRLIYGNITIKKNLPDIDFAVSYDNKVSTSPEVSQQSVKQRRTYEVGIVLSDIYGRTSPVITSDTSTIYVGAKDKQFDNTNYTGSSLNIVFKTINDPDGTIYNAATNPNGWYSYKVVVKQREQEYYNVYNPGNFYFGGSYRSYITIHADNINKIPRDTIGETDTIDDASEFVGSQVRVYPKVLNVYENNINTYRNSDFDLIDIVKIGNKSSYKGQIDASTKLFESTNDHLLGQMQGRVGVDYTQLVIGGDFSVFETEPFESALDIYYETPTSDLISNIDLNQFDIANNGIAVQPALGSTTVYQVPENSTLRQKISNIYAIDTNGGTIPGSLLSFTVTTANSDIGTRYNDGDGQWELFVAQPLPTYKFPPPGLGSQQTEFDIDVEVNFLGTTQTATITIELLNVEPEISTSTTNFVFNSDSTSSGASGTISSTSIAFKIFGSNGSLRPTDNKYDLEFQLVGFKDITSFPNSDDPQDPETATTATGLYTDYFEIIENFDVDPNNPANKVSAPGIALFNYYNQFTNHAQHKHHVFRIRLRTFEVIQTSGNPYTQVFSDVKEVYMTLDDAGSLNSDDSLIGLYYAAPNSFGNAFQACQEPITSSLWSAVNVYYIGANAVNDFPLIEFDLSTVPPTKPSRIYIDSLLSTPAKPGWYKRTDQNIIGFYYLPENARDEITGWENYNLPAICGSFTKEEAEDAVTYNPPDEVTFEEDDGSNPYDLPDFNPKPEP